MPRKCFIVYQYHKLLGSEFDAKVILKNWLRAFECDEGEGLLLGIGKLFFKLAVMKIEQPSTLCPQPFKLAHSLHRMGPLFGMNN